ncbi:MAG: fatty acid desaturase CarF family protein [Myxococcales bacterium]
MADLSGGGGDAVGPVFTAPVASAPKTYGYARSHRIAEVFGLFFGSGLLVVTAWLSVRRLPAGAWGSALACVFAGLCLADVLSGVVHWAADSYGHARMPIFGGFVRTFREHHSDQLDITRHDAIETNGDVFIFSSPVHFVLMFVVQSPWILALVFGVFLGSYCNSQIHKWAHMADPPSWVRAMQRSRLFLSAAHHSLHHSGSHESHYCITTGWMNSLLDGTRFFRGVEFALAKVGIRRTN